MRAGVVVFPGSNCDQDCYHVLKNVIKVESEYLWHRDRSIDKNIRLVVLPGGFTYGDYLRVGAIAHVSPIMSAVKKFAAKGGLVIGICNGFQILTESGLLPGALLHNNCLRFLCKTVPLKVEKRSAPWTCKPIVRWSMNWGNTARPVDRANEAARAAAGLEAGGRGVVDWRDYGA